MKATDWRELGPERVAPLYAAERARWAGLLDWDSPANWLLVEAARVQGVLPGYAYSTERGLWPGGPSTIFTRRCCRSVG